MAGLLGQCENEGMSAIVSGSFPNTVHWDVGFVLVSGVNLSKGTPWLAKATVPVPTPS